MKTVDIKFNFKGFDKDIEPNSIGYLVLIEEIESSGEKIKIDVSEPNEIKNTIYKYLISQIKINLLLQNKILENDNEIKKIYQEINKRMFRDVLNPILTNYSFKLKLVEFGKLKIVYEDNNFIVLNTSINSINFRLKELIDWVKNISINKE